MADMTVRVVLDDEGQKDLGTCMAAVAGIVDGKPRAWTMPDVLREALRRMARGVRK